MTFDVLERPELHGLLEIASGSIKDAGLPESPWEQQFMQDGVLSEQTSSLLEVLGRFSVVRGVRMRRPDTQFDIVVYEIPFARQNFDGSYNVGHSNIIGFAGVRSNGMQRIGDR